MRVTLRPRGQARLRRIAFAIWLGVSACRDSGTLHSGNIYLLWGMRAIALFLVTVYLSEALVRRWEARDDQLVAYDILNRAEWTLPYTSIRRYWPVKGSWFLLTEEGSKAIRHFETAELHRIMAERTPRALQAKRWKCGQLPPDEVVRRSLLDLRNSSAALGLFAGVAVGLGIRNGRAGDHTFPYLAAILAIVLLAYDLKDVFGTIEMASDGLTARWPWETRTIAWTEITAIFMEGSIKDRRYVVTSKKTTITVPRPIARDLDVMRKLFYSLPNGTLCVNFDETFRRGIRKRRRRGLRSRLLEPSSEPTLAPVGF